MSSDKVKKLYEKKQLNILDTRTNIEYDELHFKTSKLVKPNDLIESIEKFNKKDWVVIVGRGLRTHLPTIREVKSNGYHRVKLIDTKIEDWPDKKMLIKK